MRRLKVLGLNYILVKIKDIEVWQVKMANLKMSTPFSTSFFFCGFEMIDKNLLNNYDTEYYDNNSNL